MNTIPALAIGALLITVPARFESCQPPEEQPTCDQIELSIDMTKDTPYVYVTNHNSATIRFHMDLSGSWCGNADCPIVVSIDHSEPAGATGVYIPPTGPYCDDVICCDTGWTGSIKADFTLDGSGCKLAAAAERTACDGSDL